MRELNTETSPKPSRPERIIQFGDGNFLRGFAEWIIQSMNEKTNFDGSIVIVQPREKRNIDRLISQDCIYHVNLQGLENGKIINTLTKIDCVSRALNPYQEFGDFLKLAENPDIRFIISNTTEAGIVFDPTCKLEDKPASSFPAKIVQLLYYRFNCFGGAREKGFIILPCELIFHNGKRLKEIIYEYIKLWNLGDDFRNWFNKACRIYSTLVDRIVPGFPDKDIDRIKNQLQYDDNLVVQAEPFLLWVIEAPQEVEKEFPASKAGANVLFADSEAPYHERKVTLLNAPHTVLSPVAFLSGIDIVREACKDELVGRYIRKVIFEELMPTLSLPQEELVAFANSVLERFENPFIDHEVTAIMLNSFPKFKTRDLPALKTFYQDKGELPKGLVLGLAAIVCYYKGDCRKDGVKAEPKDSEDIISLLNRLWSTNSYVDVAQGILGATSIWEEDLNKIPMLTNTLAKYLESIQTKGMTETIKEML